MREERNKEKKKEKKKLEEPKEYKRRGGIRLTKQEQGPSKN